MLCAKTLKVAKAVFFMALGIWGVSSAYAQMNLSSEGLEGHTVVVYASETIAVGDGKMYSDIMASDGQFTVTATSDLDLDVSYVRYDLLGGYAQFGVIPENAVSGAGLTTPDQIRSTATHVIWKVDGVSKPELDQDGEVTAANPIVLNLNGQEPDNNDAADVALVKIRNASTGGDFKVVLQMRIYGQLGDALNGTNTEYVEAKKPIIAVDDTVTVAVVGGAPLVADVAKGFVGFTGSGAAAERGMLSTTYVSVKTMHFPNSEATPPSDSPAWMIVGADGQRITPETAIKPSSGEVSVSGNFSVGAFTLGNAKPELYDAAGEELETDDKGAYTSTAGAVTAKFAFSNDGAYVSSGTEGEAFAGGSQVRSLPLMINVKGNESMIPAGTYSATTEVAPAGIGAAAIPDGSFANAGRIVRNGTTVHLGYLTTYEGHNQRLVIVNRGSLDANYSLTDIITEPGTMAEPGHMATGTVMAGDSMAIQVRELISFADGGTTRAAATLSLTSNPGDVSVATTLVNKMDRSTDTVTYEAVPQ